MNAAAHSDQGKLAKGIFINGLGSLGRINRAIYLMVFSRLLDMESFGLYILAFSVMEIVSKMSVFGLDFGMMVHAGKLRAAGRPAEIRLATGRVAFAGFLISGLVALLLAAGGEWIASFVLKKPSLAPILRWFALAIPGLCLTNILVFSLRSTLNMKYENIVRSIVEPFGVLIVGAGLLLTGSGLMGTAIAHSVAAFLSAGAALYYFYRTHPKSDATSGHTVPWKSLFSSGLPMGGMELLNMFKLRLDLLVIGRFLPLASVGIYGVITELAGILRKMKALFDPILMPLSQVIHEGKDRERLRENLALALRWILVPSLAILGANLLAPEAFLRLFGVGYESGANAFRIFVVGQIFWVTLGLLEGVLAMTGHALLALFQSISLVILNLVLLLVFVPRWGLEGAALATSLSVIVISIWRLLLTHKLLGVWPVSKAQRKPLLAFAAAMVFGWSLSIQFDSKVLLEYLLVAGFFILVFVFLLYVQGIEETDRALLARVRSRLRKDT